MPGFVPLFGAQFVSSLGDWTGLFAILAIASKVSTSGTGIGLVMVARMLPGFVLAPVGGVLLDRWNRKVVMVTCDIGRAVLLALKSPHFLYPALANDGKADDFAALMQKGDQLDAQLKRNTGQRHAIERLTAEVEDLRQGLEMVEERARADLGMVKPDEILVQYAPLRR